MKTVSKFLLWGSALLATHAYPAAPMISDAGKAAITNFAAKATERGDVPGIVTLIVNREGVLYDQGYDTEIGSTRLNSSHANISYAVFCLKKKNRNNNE